MPCPVCTPCVVHRYNAVFGLELGVSSLPSLGPASSDKMSFAVPLYLLVLFSSQMVGRSPTGPAPQLVLVVLVLGCL